MPMPPQQGLPLQSQPQQPRQQGLPIGRNTQSGQLPPVHPSVVNIMRHALRAEGAGQPQAPRPNGGGMPGGGQSPIQAAQANSTLLNDRHRVDLLKHALRMTSDPIHGQDAKRVVMQHLNHPRGQQLLRHALAEHVAGRPL